MSKFPAVVVGAICYAAAGAVLWWMVNAFSRVNGVGWLKRQGPPFDNIWIAAALTGVGGFFVLLNRYRHQEENRRKLSLLSEEIDFEFQEKPRKFAPPKMRVFENLSSIEHRMSGEHNGAMVEIFDLTTAVKTDDGTTYDRKTVVLLSANDLPEFRLNAKTKFYRVLDWIGVRGLSFDPMAGVTREDQETIERFGQMYHLESCGAALLAAGDSQVFVEKDEAVRRVFTLDVLKLLAARPGWGIESHGGHLAFWHRTGIQSPEGRIPMIATALAIRETFMRPSDDSMVLRALPGDDRAGQVMRMQGSIVGGIIGFFGSFFLAALVVMILFFGRDHKANWGFPLEFLLFPIVMILGTLAGVFFGSRLPLLEPLFKMSVDPKHNRRVGCAVLFGSMVGFMVGGLIGGVLLIALDLAVENPVLPMLIFFGSAAIGAITGPILCGMAAHRLLRPKPSEEENGRTGK